MPTSNELCSLVAQPGVNHALPFFLPDESRSERVRCELVVHPALGWAIATEIEAPDSAVLVRSLVNLATQVCLDYGIDPCQLVLFIRYAFTPAYENLYAVRFGAGGRDLFNGVRFCDPRRELLNLEQLTLLEQSLLSGQGSLLHWRALAQPALSR